MNIIECSPLIFTSHTECSCLFDCNSAPPPTPVPTADVCSDQKPTKMQVLEFTHAWKIPNPLQAGTPLMHRLTIWISLNVAFDVHLSQTTWYETIKSYVLFPPAVQRLVLHPDIDMIECRL